MSIQNVSIVKYYFSIVKYYFCNFASMMVTYNLHLAGSFTVSKHILNQVVKWDHLFTNPCGKADRPKVTQLPPAALSEEQIRKALQFTE